MGRINKLFCNYVSLFFYISLTILDTCKHVVFYQIMEHDKTQTISNQPQSSSQVKDQHQYFQTPPPPYVYPSHSPPEYEQCVEIDIQKSTSQPGNNNLPHQQSISDNGIARLRIAALVMAAFSCTFGCCLLSIPAIVTAVLPESWGRNGNIQCLYKSSLILSTISIIITVLLVIVIVVNVVAKG